MDCSVAPRVRAMISPSALRGFRLRKLAAVPLLMGCSCRRPDGSIELQLGDLVTGPGATDFGLGQGDTLPELSADHTPDAVRASADQQAKLFRCRPRCTRYFRADSLYVALLIARCEAGRVVDDSQGMAAYTARGEPTGPPTPVVRTEYVVLRPERRDRE